MKLNKLYNLAEKENIKIYDWHIEDCTGIYINYDKINAIALNYDELGTYIDEKCTLAHELGHYFLHREMLKSSDVHIDTLYRATIQTNINTKEQEREVDYFAGALLMNRMAIEKLIDNYTVADLAELFKVSSSAMAVRLYILGLL